MIIIITITMEQKRAILKLSYPLIAKRTFSKTHRLVGLEVKASTSRAAHLGSIPGCAEVFPVRVTSAHRFFLFESHQRRDFSCSSHISLEIFPVRVTSAQRFFLFESHQRRDFSCSSHISLEIFPVRVTSA